MEIISNIKQPVEKKECIVHDAIKTINNIKTRGGTMMEHVLKLLEKVSKVLVYDANTAERLKNLNFKVTPKYDYEPEITPEDKLEMRSKLVGFIVERNMQLV